MTSTTNPTPPARATWRQWLGLGALVLPVFMMATDMTVLFLAQPAIAADLEPSGAQALWILHVGEFLAAGFVITMGRLTDRLGRRRLLTIGVAVYGAASVVAALSLTAELLIGSRALLGVAAATIMPSALALLRNMFADARQFSVAFATLMAAFSAGAALGPPLGGLLLEHFWWGAVFLANVPAAAILLLAAPWLLPVYRDPSAGRLDLASIALSVTAIMATIFGLQQMADRGAAQPGYLAAVVLGLAVATVFLRRQRRLDDPLLDLRLLATPAMRVSLATIALALVAFMGTDMLFAQFLQVGAGLSSATAGLVLMVSGIGSIVGSMLAPVLLRRLRPSSVIAVGLATGAGAFGLAIALLPTVADGGSVLWLVTIAALAGLSMIAVVPLGQIVLTSAPLERTGSATAMQDLSGGLGGAMGMAFIGSLSLLVYRTGLAGAGPEGVSPAELRSAEGSAGAGVAVADQLDGSAGGQLLDAVRASLTTSTRVAYAVGLAVLVGVTLLVVTRLRHVRLDTDADPDADPEVDAGEADLATGTGVAP